ncbi:MAG: molybdopterin cofactor-binding domain-containing protein, partial [Chitinophagaceae bacterium]
MKNSGFSIYQLPSLVIGKVTFMKPSFRNPGRRRFLKSSMLAGGGLLISFSWPGSRVFAQGGNVADLPADWSELTGYIKISPDNLIKILNPNPEFGQNVMTSLPMIVAEELDADWKTVIVEMAPHDASKLGPQFTGGSNSVRMYWKPLREAGAAARQMLREAAAQNWGVPVIEVTTGESMLYHKATGRSATYGSVASKAATLPIPKNVPLKNIKDFNIVRKPTRNVEGAKVVAGTALFGLDYQHTGMLIAMIEHPPAFGLKVKSFDATAALTMPGITNVFQQQLYEDGFEQGGFDTRTFNELLVIVGKTTWEVMQARKKLKVTWEPVGDTKDLMGGRGQKREVIIPGALESTEVQLEKMRALASQPAQQLRKDGDPEAGFRNAAQVIERTYYAPFLAHNCMEPMNFFAHVTDEKALFAGPLQAPGWAEPTLAKVLKLPAEKIEIQMTRMGGGFGRRAYAHYLVEAGL